MIFLLLLMCFHKRNSALSLFQKHWKCVHLRTFSNWNRTFAKR